jgi:hypothetical protein
MIALQLNTLPARRAISTAASLSPRARTADKATSARASTRARKHHSIRFPTLIVATAAACSLALAYVSESASATEASYRIAALKAQQAKLIAEQQQIRYQISLSSSAGQVDGRAAALGMVRAPHWQYLPSTASPLALAPAAVEPARPRMGWIDELAAVLGRPTEAEARGP